MIQKKNQRNRILSFFLAVIMFIGSVPMPVFSADSKPAVSADSAPYDGQTETAYITLDGRRIDEMDLGIHEKKELRVHSPAGARQLQWQIQRPEKEGLWVNIYDATAETLFVSMALARNMLDSDGAVTLRCKMMVDDEQLYTGPVTVRILGGDHQLDAPQVNRYATGVMPLAEGEDDPTTPTEPSHAEYVVVRIDYVRYDYEWNPVMNKLELEEKGKAFDSYIATLQYGSDLKDTTVNFPTMIGYDTYYNGVKQSELTFALDSVTSDKTYTVEYRPAKVNYAVRYYMQNIYDDLYVEDTDAAKTLEGETGTAPDPQWVNRPFEGFSSLFYQPDYIAADGSTVFEVYYERNYYLMEFDCAGGYGADTVYVRYGTYISIPNPVKAGWTFGGWDLVRTEKTGNTDQLDNKAADTLPATMPAYNSAYRALWIQADTQYSVVYWIVNDDGTRSYVGSSIRSGTTGTEIDGRDDLGNEDVYICGQLAHTHSDACYLCNQNEHKHTYDGCFTPGTLEWNNPDNGLNAIRALEGGGKSESGYVYAIYSHQYGTYWPKLYLEDANGNGNYYHIVGCYGGTDESSFSAIIDGEPLASLTDVFNGEQLTVRKYRVKADCATVQHIHDSSCMLCEAHTHTTEKCKKDTTYLDYKADVTVSGKTYTTDQDVVLEGDGSSVVNVYYQYKQYTLRFYYAATTGGTDTDSNGTIDGDEYDTVKIVGGCTYHFGAWATDSSSDESCMKNMWDNSGQWGTVDELPGLNAKGTARNYQKGSVTYTFYNQDIAFHYISFTARYGDDISDLWPCDVFEPVETDYTNTQKPLWLGTKAVVSAWNGEDHVRYSRENSNQTIKGVYEKLDENLLFINGGEYDQIDSEKGVVSYLCFWENGADIDWNTPELYRYNVYLETYRGQDLTDVETVTKNDGKTYYLAYTYDTCDDSTPGQQTQTTLHGFTKKTFPQNSHDGYKYYEVRDSNPKIFFEYRDLSPTYDSALAASQPSTYYDKNVYNEGYDVNFYYTRNRYKLTFWNHDSYLTDGTGANIAYQEPLERQFEGIEVDGVEYEGANDLVKKQDKYPRTLEPKSYTFQGWYTSPEFIDDTLVNADTMTMPSEDLKVYAKWEPVIRNVYFYYQYDHIAANQPWTEPTDEDGNRVADREGNPVTITYPIKVPHGTLLGTTYSYKPKRDGYTFVGWFYMDEDNKKRFAPDTMEVSRDLHLFAEWQSSIDTTYKVTYVLKEGYDTYPAGHVIADETTGHITAGKTKTFQAKSMTDLYSDFRTGYFPEINSHSILMDPDGKNNTFVFQYMHDDRVLYKVRYVNAVTGVVMEESAVMETSHAIVTAKFKPFQDMLPQTYYIRRTLAYDGQAKAPIDANILTFYYTPDTAHGLYSIEYYLENADSTDWKDPANYTQSESIVGSGNINTTLTATVRSYDGYTHVPSMNTVVTFDTEGEVASEMTGVGAGNNPPAPYGTISNNGLTIKLYYQRNSYPYQIVYKNADSGEVLTPQDPELAKPLGEKRAKFDAEFTHTAAASFVASDGKTYEYYQANATDAQRTQKRTVKASDNVADNTMTFYFVQKKVTVIYHPVCTVKRENKFDFGYVSPGSEWGTRAGSTATALNGFRFVGWYKDEACTEKVDSTWVSGAKLTPKELYEDEDWTNHYYALFEPVKENLRITKTAAEGTSLGTDTFLFRVTGTDVLGDTVDLTVSIQGEGSVTIRDLYCGTYTVTELTGWSWAYDCTGATSGKVTLTTQDRDGGGNLLAEQITTYTVGFTNASKTVDWLHGESEACENKFQISK